MNASWGVQIVPKIVKVAKTNPLFGDFCVFSVGTQSLFQII
jgi:hypothetical protein